MNFSLAVGTCAFESVSSDLVNPPFVDFAWNMNLFINFLLGLKSTKFGVMISKKQEGWLNHVILLNNAYIGSYRLRSLGGK